MWHRYVLVCVCCVRVRGETGRGDRRPEQVSNGGIETMHERIVASTQSAGLGTGGKQQQQQQQQQQRYLNDHVNPWDVSTNQIAPLSENMNDVI